MKVIVVGGGPAGIMAAIRAAGLGHDILLIEKNESLGKKLLLTGKGRCNITNTADLDNFLKRFSRNGQFLRDAFKIFSNNSLVRFFEERGLKLKTERQGRVFPDTDRSQSVLFVLRKALSESGVKVLYRSCLKKVIVENKAISGILLTNNKSLDCDRLVLATGGISYPFTGSDGRGIKIAKRIGHTPTRLRPGLVALRTKEAWVKALEGLALKNIALNIVYGKKKVHTEVGELLFTSNGISGPLILTLSGDILDSLSEGKRALVNIDLKPALSTEKLDKRLIREFEAAPGKKIVNILKALLPVRMVDIFMELSGIEQGKKANQITHNERKGLISLLKALPVEVIGSAGIDRAMVTRGGISLKEIDPRTMQSRIIKGLFFAGEIIDVDADTGGFNLQAAFSTGYLAGSSL